MRTFRLFVSSPADADVERRRTENVVSRLNGEFAGLARIETVRWETELYQAHETFQTQIPEAANCDIVVGILRWRLGAELPPDFPGRLPGNEPYPSGTAYEILSSVEKRRAGSALPDVYVFRYTGSPPQLLIGQSDEEKVRRGWAALQGFFSRWFITPEGHFVAALNGYASEDQFENQLENLLRKWIAEQVSDGRIVPWPSTKGSPFRNLDAFGAKHTPVFFGRAADIRKITDLLRDYASRSAHFLLLVGGSGSGKSSLARAGLIPRLTTPGVMAEADVWRIGVVRPSDSADGPFAALAAALLQSESTLPPDEEGRGSALPEIAEGDCETPAELAALLKHADASAVRPVLKALTTIGERVQARERFDRTVRCNLVLLVDQFEELFSPSIPEEVRNQFTALLAALHDSGRVWLIVTLRDDLYGPALKIPAFKSLKDIGASYDLAPPGAAELAEIVREPAKAAGLKFATDPATGERLDERLLREADRSDVLPLVQLALGRLWDAREIDAGAAVLPVTAYERFGGLKGIVAEAGEAALKKAGQAAADRLAPLIRCLAEIAPGKAGAPSTLTIRAVPLPEVTQDANDRRLVDELVAARLLTLAAPALSHGADGGEANVLVRLTHQRVLTDWDRVANIVADSADFYRVRDEVDAQRRRWEEGKRRGELLLARGLPLAEARAMTAKYGGELPGELRAYITASQRRAGRAQMLSWAAAVTFAFVAAGAGVATKIARDRTAQVESERREAEAARQIAERNFTAAKDTVDGLIVNVFDGLGNVAGMRVETLRNILETVRQTVDKLLETIPDDERLLRSRAAMLTDFGKVYMAAGDLKDATASFSDGLDIRRKLAARNPTNMPAQFEVAYSLYEIGLAHHWGGNSGGALAAYEESLGIARRLSVQEPGDVIVQLTISDNLVAIGDVKFRLNEYKEGSIDYDESLVVIHKLAAENSLNEAVQDRLSTSFSRIGDSKFMSGDFAGALAARKEALDISRKSAAMNPNSAGLRDNVSTRLQSYGDTAAQMGDMAACVAAYEESIAISRDLAAQDPTNTVLQEAVPQNLAKLSRVRFLVGDLAGALVAKQEELGVRRKLAELNSGNMETQRLLMESLIQVADLRYSNGHKSMAWSAYGEGIAIARRLAVQETDRSPLLLYDAFGCMTRFGDVMLQEKDREGALAIYQESLGLARKVAALDATNTHSSLDVLIALGKIGNTKWQGSDVAGTLAAYQEGLDIAHKFAAQNQGDAQVQHQLAAWLGFTSYVTVFAGKYPEALALADEAIAVEPNTMAFQYERARALMLVGRTEEARKIYMDYRGKITQGPTWEQSVKDDFAALRKVGIQDALMTEIEGAFSKQ
jgi:tetratricopeptide (TPR) repeat protein